ncbi:MULTISPECIES: ABC transporter permease [Actinomadura]|uniref:FtsX-like permease family protein n=1 Tax=Actinomadura yumaensis TaxID=111807 RepID=A0ABW2CF58_9ACTN|nr:ABC transporter permease [Actinomadura sp. J1-007]MWK35837.1 FtsX-like permease family protein [Actinomadura sp. J1-007]
MLSLSFSTFRDRWRLFAGAIVAVALGVALVQSSLLVMVSTDRAPVPPGASGRVREQIREGYAGAATLLGMTVMLSVFLTVFIVGSTFAFTVAQRRRDLALLRLVGGGRGQLVLLLLAEALLLGLAGTALGAAAGVPATWAQARLLIALGFLPDGFAPVLWDSGAAVASACVGIAVSLAGVLAASRRAAKVRPLDALRDTGASARVMTPMRWLSGVSGLALTVLMVALAQSAELLGAMMLALGISITGGVALSALSPLVVPLAGRALGVALRRSTLGEIAQANLRDGVRRSASTAAPLIVLVALLVGLAGTLGSLALMSGEEQRRLVRGDLVVESPGAAAERIAAVPGVAAASPEVTVPISVTARHHEEGRSWRRTHYSGIVAVDPPAYRRAHKVRLLAGSFDRLRGRTIALGPGMAAEGVRVGSTVTARVGGHAVRLKVVAAFVPTLENYSETFLVPRDVVPAPVRAGGEAQTVVRVAPGTEPAQVRERVRAAGLGRARTVAQWADARTAEQQRGNLGILAVLMGMAGGYAVVAVINAVVIAGTERRAEFAAARVAGMSRPQVVRAALVESWAVTAIGLVLGCAVAGGALSGMLAASLRGAGRPLVAVPWTLLAAVTVGAFAVTGATSVWTTFSATRPRPVTLLTTRE